MSMVSVRDLALQHGESRKKVDDAIKMLAIKKTKIGKKVFIEPEDAEMVLRQLALPEELQATMHRAKWLRDAPNKRWVYTKVEDHEGAIPVLIPARFAGKLKNKHFLVQKIQDKDGTTFRHSYFGKSNVGTSYYSD